MDAPTTEVGYTSATTRKGDHESLYGHVVAMGGIHTIQRKVQGKISYFISEGVKFKQKPRT
jgi:hypothetical protein